MANKFLALALAAICISQVSAASTTIRRSANEQPTTVQGLVDNANAMLRRLGDDISEWIGAPSVEQMRDLLVNKTKDFEERTASVVAELRRQVETHGPALSERMKEVIQEATTQLNESVQKMKESAPELVNQASEMQTKFNEAFKQGIETMIKETREVAKAAGDDVGEVHDDITNLARNAMNQTVDLLQQFHNDVRSAIATSS